MSIKGATPNLNCKTLFLSNPYPTYVAILLIFAASSHCKSPRILLALPGHEVLPWLVLSEPPLGPLEDLLLKIPPQTGRCHSLGSAGEPKSGTADSTFFRVFFVNP